MRAAVSTFNLRIVVFALLGVTLVGLGIDSLAGWPVILPPFTPELALVIGLGAVVSGIGAFRLGRTTVQRLISLGPLVLLAGGVWLLFLLAGHFGFAVPVPRAPRNDGLPARMTYANRHYQSLGESCWTQDFLISHDYWPPVEVAAIPTLFGPPHPVMIPRSASQGTALSPTPAVLLVPRGAGCYLTYSLEGGP